jgi:hypothetical protein
VEGEERRAPRSVIGPDRDISAFPWDCDAPGWGSHVGPGPVQATIERMGARAVANRRLRHHDRMPDG